MRRVTIRLDADTYEKLKRELEKWRQFRGPKFSLNELCREKLAYAMPISGWAKVKGA